MCLTNYCVAPYCMQYMLHVLDMHRIAPKPELYKCNLFLCLCVSYIFLTSPLVPVLQNKKAKGTANFKEQKKTLRDKTASSVLCLPPDVLFSDEFSSLYSAIVIYIGPA